MLFRDNVSYTYAINKNTYYLWLVAGPAALLSASRYCRVGNNAAVSGGSVESVKKEKTLFA